MNYDLLFKVTNISVIPAWLLLVTLPNHSITKAVVHSYLYPVLLSVFYTILLFTSFGGDGGMDSIENLSIAFARPNIVVLGWAHYLVFDLFIGAWISRDAMKHKISYFLVSPTLLLTLFAGPFGLLLYLILRWTKLKSFQL